MHTNALAFVCIITRIAVYCNQGFPWGKLSPQVTDEGIKPSPLGVVLHAANLAIAMIAGGNHTLIPRWHGEAVTDVGCSGFVPVLSERKAFPHRGKVPQCAHWGG